MRSILFLIVFLVPICLCAEEKENTYWYYQDYELDGIPGISLDRAYELLKNKSPKKQVIVAVLDDGVDIKHKDYQGKIWMNKDEIPGNGIDDDANGYIDDVHGWNFLGNAKGENLINETWILTRMFVSLDKKFKNIDESQLKAEQLKEYRQYLELKNDFENQRNQTKNTYEQWSSSKKAFDAHINNISKYVEGQDFSKEVILSLEVSEGDTLAVKSLAILKKWYAAGYSKQMIDLRFNSFKNRYLYKLNPEFESRSIIGDDPENLDERNYGNPNVFVEGQFHGTTVSGFIAANRNNGFGMEGIAENVLIMPVRIVPSGDERDKDIANGIYYAVDNGANIINMSFGKPFSPHQKHVEKAIRYAESKGVLMVTGSGNDGHSSDVNPRYPNQFYNDKTTCSTWICVGSTTINADTALVAPFSNYGSNTVDVMAPGNNLLTLFPDNNTIVSEGTSLSSPIVCGVAALVWSYFPELTAQELKQVLLKSVTDFSELEVVVPDKPTKKVLFKEMCKTGGIINAYRAIKLAEKI